MGKFIPTGATVTRVIVSLSTAAMLSGAGVLLPQVAAAVTIDELLAQIAALQAQLVTLQAASAPAAGKCTFTQNLTVGSRGDDVKCLQAYLSVSPQSGYFGPLTKAAVAKWQSDNGVSPAAGYFGSISRAKYSSLMSGVTPAPAPTPATPGTPPAATGTGLTVAAGTQPGDSLAPKNAARVPATRFTLTASADGDVKVNSITVERQGPSADSAVDGVVILGGDGLQIGLSKKLNSNHQAVLNEPLTIKAGTSKTYTIAMNRPATASDGGDIVKLAVVAIDAGAAAVNGSLPIVGSPITMNSSLTIGTVTLTRGVNDPGTGATKEIGTTGYIFTAIRVTAGAAEDLKMKWVSLNQSGSAATTDLKNVKVNFDGTDYPITISADGKYYTANFGDGVTITKGNTKEFYVKGDIESGTNRGIDFDLYRFTDLYVTGSQFGYGLTPTATDSGDSSTDDDGTFQATNPIWDAYEATVGAGSLTVTKSTVLPAQNIAVNLNEQPLGAFDVEVKGEAVNVTSLIMRVGLTSNAGSPVNVTEADYTQVSLYDNATGKVIAGPLDGSGTTDAQMVFTFTDSITFPIGKYAYLLKGKLSTDFSSDNLVAASTTPSGWTATGAVSGNTITPSPTTAVTGNSFTVKTATSSLSLSNEPTNQNVVAGTTGFTFAKVLFDGTASGEDVRFTSAQFALETDTGSSNPTNCQLFDGTTALNTGTNVQNPTSDGQKTFTLDKNLIIPKGTLKTVSLKCDVAANLTADDTIEWKLNIGATFGATGLTSGNTVTPTLNNGSNANSTNDNNKMTIKSGGTITVALDGSSPSVRLAQSGQEVILSVLRLTGTNEDLNVKQIAFQLSNTASNTPQDLSSITLWDGSTKVGEAVLTSLDNATATLSNFIVLKDGSKNLTVKGVIGNIGVNQPARPGHLVTVDWDRDASSDNLNSATYAVGVQSSTNVYASRTAGDTASAGARIVRAYPSISILSVPSTSLADAAQKVLYRFSVTPTSGANGVSLFKFTFSIATSGDDAGIDFTIQSLRLYAFTASNFSGGAFSADGQLNNGTTFFSSEGGNDAVENDRATTTDYAIYFNPANPNNTGANSREAINVPAGSTYYFELRGDVSGADTGDSATVQLMGDDRWHGFCDNAGVCQDAGFLAGSINYAFATTAPFLDDGSVNVRSGGKNVGATGNNADDNQSGDDFIWSGNSTTTHSGGGNDIMGADWYNGFIVPGLPSSGAQSNSFSL